MKTSMKRVKWFFFILPAILFLVVPSIALAETKTFSAVKDTYANKAYPDDPKGSIGSIILSNKYTDRLGYVQFEEISLPEGAILDQATFKFYVYSVNYATSAKFNVGPVTEDWEEGSLTWNNKPTINQSQAIEANISLTEGWKTASATNLVRGWLDGSLENKGLFIYPYGFLYGTPETEFALSFRSREHGDNPPQLEVEYHLPEPSPSPSPEPEVEPSLEPGEEELIAIPEVSPTPTPEAEEKGGLVLSLTSGQAIIGGLILLALLAAGIAFIVYWNKNGKKPKEEKKEAD